MPESFGKRQRREVKAKKAVAREQRRVARNERRQDRSTGAIDEQAEGVAIGPPGHEGIVDAPPDAGDAETDPET